MSKSSSVQNLRSLCFVSKMFYDLRWLQFVDQIRRLLGNTTQSLSTWSVFSKSISVSQLVAVPLKSSGSRTSLRSRSPAASNWKMELSQLEGYMNRDSLTQPFVWLRWIQPDSNTVPALRQGLHYGQILPDTHSSKTLQKLSTDTPLLYCTMVEDTAGPFVDIWL